VLPESQEAGVGSVARTEVLVRRLAEAVKMLEKRMYDAQALVRKHSAGCKSHANARAAARLAQWNTL